MKKAIAALTILFIAQLTLSIVLFSPDPQDKATGQPLIHVNRSQIDHIEITDDQQRTLLLTRQGGHWTLPGHGGATVNASAIKTFLDRISELKAGWPVAKTPDAASHFKVARRHFVRRLTLSNKKHILTRIYLGSSPGFRKVHARLEGKSPIYAVTFNSFDANATADDWIDKHVLKIDDDTISAIQLPAFSLHRSGLGMSIDGLKADEIMRTDETAKLVEYLSDLVISGLADPDIKPGTRPALAFHLTIDNEGTRDYRFFAIKPGVDYILKVSGQGQGFRVTASTIDHIKAFSRDKLIDTQADENPDMPNVPVRNASPSKDP